MKHDAMLSAAPTAGISRLSLIKAAGVGSLAAGLSLAPSPLFAQSPSNGDDDQGQPQRYPDNPAPLETRTIPELYQAALAEGGNLNVVEGGDSINQESSLEAAFRSAFPKMNLSLTVDLSKYNSARVDLAFAKGTTLPDVIHLQTIEDFPRWKREGRLLNYKPLGWEHVYPQFKDCDGAWTALNTLIFTNVVNTTIIPADQAPRNFLDYLDPEYKNKLVFLYPDDDDASLYLFYAAITEHGWSYMDRLMENNPLFVRGAARISDIVSSGQRVATTLRIPPQPSCGPVGTCCRAPRPL